MTTAKEREVLRKLLHSPSMRCTQCDTTRRVMNELDALLKAFDPVHVLVWDGTGAHCVCNEWSMGPVPDNPEGRRVAQDSYEAHVREDIMNAFIAMADGDDPK